MDASRLFAGDIGFANLDQSAAGPDDGRGCVAQAASSQPLNDADEDDGSCYVQRDMDLAFLPAGINDQTSLLQVRSVRWHMYDLPLLRWYKVVTLFVCIYNSYEYFVLQEAAKSIPTSSKRLPADGDATAEILAGPNGVLAVCSQSGKPEPDYDPLWSVRAFVSLFPNGCGQAPTGTSLEYWVRVLLMRSDRSHARSSLFILAMYDIITRHKANTSAWIQNRMSSEQVAKIGRLSKRQFELVMVILKAGHRGAELTRQLVAGGPGTVPKSPRLSIPKRFLPDI
jgi:hypothetical protein